MIRKNITYIWGTSKSKEKEKEGSENDGKEDRASKNLVFRAVLSF
jgi:hypothetical protein